MMHQLKTNARPQSNDEFEDFLKEPAYDTGLDALQWWLDPVQQKRWPRLSSFAINILSIPAMSDKPETVFSGSRRTIRWDRAKLGEIMIECVECLKHWFRDSKVWKYFG
jgi:hypothetical protein